MSDEMYEDATIDPLEAEFAALLDEHLPDTAPKEAGELIDAVVVGIVDDTVLVSTGAKMEAGIAIREFLDPRGEPAVNVGDALRVVVTGYDRNGTPHVSYKEARAVEAARMLEEAVEHKRPVRGTISRAVRGGVLVDVGMPAFMPASHIDLFRVGDLEAFVGREVEAHVLEYDTRKGRAVLSRRQLLQERKDAKHQEFLQKASPGDTLKGIVRDVLDFGAFVEFEEGVEGLIPRSEISYERGIHPKDVLSAGQEVEVKVLDLSAESGKITLSRKRANRDPWENIEELYPIGSTVAGKVTGIQDFGAFINLQEGITGLIHAKDISWESESKTPKDTFREGDTVTCQVLEIDKEKKRLALSLKHLTRDPWTDLEDKYPAGTKHKGTVTGIRPFGAFVKLDDYTEGLVHVSDLSWTERVKHPSEMLEEGQEVEVVILNLDREQRRIGLGIKQLAASPMEAFEKKHRVGSIAEGKVTRFAPFGAFVELEPGLEGLIHISEVADGRIDSAEKVLKLGEEVKVKVLAIDKGKNRISLSRQRAIKEEEEANIRQYLKKDNESGGMGFGDALRAALDQKKE